MATRRNGQQFVDMELQADAKHQQDDAESRRTAQRFSDRPPDPAY
jgi:hypothetical protein